MQSSTDDGSKNFAEKSRKSFVFKTSESGEASTDMEMVDGGPGSGLRTLSYKQATEHRINMGWSPDSGDVKKNPISDDYDEEDAMFDTQKDIGKRSSKFASMFTGNMAGSSFGLSGDDSTATYLVGRNWRTSSKWAHATDEDITIALKLLMESLKPDFAKGLSTGSQLAPEQTSASVPRLMEFDAPSSEYSEIKDIRSQEQILKKSAYAQLSFPENGKQPAPVATESTQYAQVVKNSQTSFKAKSDTRTYTLRDMGTEVVLSTLQTSIYLSRLLILKQKAVMHPASTKQSKLQQMLSLID